MSVGVPEPWTKGVTEKKVYVCAEVDSEGGVETNLGQISFSRRIDEVGFIGEPVRNEGERRKEEIS